MELSNESCARDYHARNKQIIYCCIASGPSLTSIDVSLVEKWRFEKTTEIRLVIVINNSYELATWADVLYACDDEWWNHYFNSASLVFKGAFWTQHQSGERYKINRIIGKNGKGLGKDCIHFGGNSGYQSINLAYLWGAKKIILLGFDMKKTNGQSHWHGDHHGKLKMNSPYSDFVKSFNKLADDLKSEGIHVINATRNTALNCFEKMNLENALGMTL